MIEGKDLFLLFVVAAGVIWMLVKDQTIDDGD